MEAFSFSSQYGISTKINGLLSSKRSGGIINESLFLGVKNWYMTLFKNLGGLSAFRIMYTLMYWQN